MLVRIGDKDDCCRYSGANKDGDYTLFSMDTYERFRKNTPEFEELVAIQAGFENWGDGCAARRWTGHGPVRGE